jgi:G3E family GTPase
MKNTKIHIVSGFLGAGKSTFIKKMLKEEAFGNAPMLIENDYGSLGIDGDIMKQTGIMVVELNSGCICCTLEGSFTKALEQFCLQNQPENVIIEPSGVGKLSGICSAIQKADFQIPITVEKCITIVDAKKFDYNQKYVTEYFEDQIRSADTVVLSKIKKVAPDKLEAICEKIRSLNPNANVISKPWEEPLKDSVYCTSASLLSSNFVDVPDTSNNDTESGWESVSFQIHHTYGEEEIGRLVKSLANEELYGKVFRAKGVIDTENGRKQIDYVSGELQMVDTDLEVTSKLLVIGKGLRKENLYQLFAIPVRWVGPRVRNRRRMHV